MKSVFTEMEPLAPYKDLVFPGKAEDEKILYVTRESPYMLFVRLTSFMAVIGAILVVGTLLLNSVGETFEIHVGILVALLLILGAAIMFGGLWWVYRVYQKTLFIITTRRLTKFIHTTPWTRYQMSLTLDKVVDSAAYSKGYIQAMFGLGTFVARSSAGNIKNFKIENIHFSEDLHNWMNKLMFTFSNELSKLDDFKPFVAKPMGKRD